MSQMSELDAEFKDMTKDMTYAELKEAFEALMFCESKGVRDELMQSLYARELDRRESLWKEVTV
jgi:hypothetical protein